MFNSQISRRKTFRQDYSEAIGYVSDFSQNSKDYSKNLHQYHPRNVFNSQTSRRKTVRRNYSEVTGYTSHYSQNSKDYSKNLYQNHSTKKIEIKVIPENEEICSCSEFSQICSCSESNSEK
jgi:murein tripeptide amidase MpaA